jgi:hypothetical protein
MAQQTDDEEYDDDDYDDDEDDDGDYDDDDDDDGEESEAEPWDLLSQALGSLDELGTDEDLAVDVSERAPESKEPEIFTKVPLDQVANLIAVRALASGIKDGSITIEVYRSRLKLMVRSLEDGLKVVSSETVVNQIQALPEEQKVFFTQTSKLVEALVQGGHRMLRYSETKQFSDVDEGLAVIESAFVELDEVQSKVIDVAREIALRETATGE